MDDVRYMISEASKKVGVESHTLRYWEEELKLPIGRNEMGHRYYKESDIDLLITIKQLKEKGFQLKAINMLLPSLDKPGAFNCQALINLKNELGERMINMNEEEKTCGQVDNEETSLASGERMHEIEEPHEKMRQFRAVMSQIIKSALKENNLELSGEISSSVTNAVISEMNYLMRLQEEKEEERFRRFDATLRDYQRSRMHAAAAFEGRKKRKSKFFKKHRIHI